MVKKEDANTRVQVKIRIRPELLGQLSTHAELSNRTLSGEVTHRLEKSLDEEWSTLRVRIESRTAAEGAAAAKELTELKGLLSRLEEAISLVLGPPWDKSADTRAFVNEGVVPLKRAG